MAEMNMVEAIRSALKLEMERDERVIVMGEDVGHLGGVFRATDGLQQFFGSSRVIDTPLAESVIAGSALGLAITGMVPVIEMQFLGFTQQALHQICQQMSRVRFRTRGSHTAQITIRSPFGGGVRTPEFHSDSMEAQFAQSSGLKIAMPANPYDAKGLLLEAIRDPDPVLYLEPLRGYRLITGEVPRDDYTVPFGRLRVVREGTDVTVIAWSGAVPVAEKAAEIAAEQGISAHVVDLRTLVPLDEEGLVAAVEKTGRCVVVHESVALAGFGAEVIAFLQEQAFYSLEAPMRRVTAPDAPYPMPGIEDFYIPTAEQVARAIAQTMADQ
jgi:pyruvate dehydrogenase E1 component beta subunit